MAVKVGFADLTHTGQIVAANTVPLGIAMVAQYAITTLGDRIDAEIFRYPEEFGKYLDENEPKIACFSNFSWNLSLAHEYARRLKKRSPETVIVFGGPNFPTDRSEQEAFLNEYPAIDFYIDGEGEFAFVELFEALEANGFDEAALRAAKTEFHNTYYLADGEFVVGEMLPRITDIGVIPSVYESGLCDKFFDDVLMPMMQTARGCPYQCSFCHEGFRYFNKTKRITQDRVSRELKYIAERVKVPDLLIVDSNFGMFEKDLDTARDIAALREERNWPEYVIVATAKNHKDRVIEAAGLLKGALPPGASIQTTDPNVLEIIKRKNLPLESIAKIGATAETAAANSFSEVILCLPGDTKAAHFKSVFDMASAGINYLRNYQFMMLNGTEAANKESRAKYEMQTVYRVLPRCFGTYEFDGETFQVAEVEEICVANNTMPFEDYQDCRALDLSVEIFNNGGLFADLNRFLVARGAGREEFLRRAHELVVKGDGVISGFYRDFRDEEDRNLWKDKQELVDFIQEPGVIQRYIDGEFGTNELYKYRALAVFHHMPELHEIAYAAARDILRAKDALDEQTDTYLSELSRFSLIRKHNLLDLDSSVEEAFQFDFTELDKSNYTIDPFSVYRPTGVNVRVYHSNEQRQMIAGYIRQYGTSLIGLGRILLRSHIGAFYRRSA